MDLQLAWLCILLPFAGALLTPFFARISPLLRDYGAVFFAFLTALSALMMLPLLGTAELLPLEAKYLWLETPIKITAGVLLDPLSIVVANVVAVISFFIMVYCLGYMKGNPEVTRFWMLMNAFIGSMLLLVLANDLIIIFIGWKLVGLCSYGLISFYYRDEKKYWIGGPDPYPFSKPTNCGFKAMLVTSVGDMLMLGGFLLMYYYSGTFNVLELYQTAPVWVPEMAAKPGMIILVTILLIAGPVGKSAQFPLHEWLPEAMSGPGPVSALIHAATMVKSGVFLIARLIPIFYFAYWQAGVDAALTFFYIVAWVGAITAFLAASQGMVALELKKVLAYSTVSQIGFMMMALGVAGFSQELLVKGYAAGIFHLVSHAMFKACLFLCAGTVIHAAHSIYINEMGALRKHLPFTWIFMGLAALALIGVPPLPGFWSKEAVLLATLESHHYGLFAIGLASVVFTAFYTMRFLGMVFHGRPSEHISKETAKPGHHVGEGYAPQTFACGVLAVAIVIFGLLGPWADKMFYGLFTTQLVEGLGLAVEPLVRDFSTALMVALSLGAVAIGVVPAYLFYVNNRWSATGVYKKVGLVRVIHQFFWDRWYIDKFFYNFIFVRGIRRLSEMIARRVEPAADALVHIKMPNLLIRGGTGLMALLRADTRDLSSNMVYILVMTIIFIGLAFSRMLS